MKKGILFLAVSILSEAFGTTMLKLSDGFTVFGPSVGVILGFLIAFIFLSFSLKTIPLSVAYSTWAGVGTALTVCIGVFFFQEPIDLLKIGAVILIIAGIVLLNTANSSNKEPVSTRTTVVE